MADQTVVDDGDETVEPEAPAVRASGGIRDVANRLYQGDAGFDIVGKRKIYYLVAAGILVVGLAALIWGKPNLGIEFQGGNAFTVPASLGSMQDVRAVVEEKAPGEYHVVLPANLEWGASIPNRGGQPVEIRNARGMVCWDIQGLDTRGCSGPAGGGPAGEGFLAPGAAAGALVNRNRDGRTWFSVNDRNGRNFADNQGYFEFEIVTRR